MKKIVLIPVKNEAWILRQSLRNFSSFADHIIVADQGSTDGSREIYKEFSKVDVIENSATGHSNSVRWLLLDHMRHAYNGTEKKLILCLDADEMISKEVVLEMEKIALIKLRNRKETISFQIPWIQLWENINRYRWDGVWVNNYKAIAFVEDESLDYGRRLVINDHTARIPTTSEIITLTEKPLLHFQYIAWEASQIKQAWYRVSEKIEGRKSSKYINNKYKDSGTSGLLIKETPREWLEMIPEAKEVKDPGILNNWHLNEIFNWFRKYGILFFEPLDIWHIKPLHAIFYEQNNRKPKPKFYSKVTLSLNIIRNKIKKCLKEFIQN